ncbi:MAG: hypothetical protein ACXU8N_15110 [Telluria sp.]
MRKLVLLLPLLLAGCVSDSASYYIDGNDHAITVRLEQAYFWDDTATLYVTAARLPDCQRRVTLKQVPVEGFQAQLVANGDNAYTLKVGNEAWGIDTLGCAVGAGQADGTLLGTFRLVDEKVVFEEAKR